MCKKNETNIFLGRKAKCYRLEAFYFKLWWEKVPIKKQWQICSCYPESIFNLDVRQQICTKNERLLLNIYDQCHFFMGFQTLICFIERKITIRVFDDRLVEKKDIFFFKNRNLISPKKTKQGWREGIAIHFSILSRSKWKEIQINCFIYLRG